ncbi:MAG: T9SS type A sorting domain-containing protein, partial [Ignavibacteria bacterium]
NLGESWNELQIYPKIKDPLSLFLSDGDSLFIGDATKGFLLTTDGGLNWQVLNKGLEASIFTIGGNKDFVYAGSNIGNLFRSSDNGSTWVISYTFPATPCVDIAVFNEKIVVVSSCHAFRSFDNGETWLDSIVTCNWYEPNYFFAQFNSYGLLYGGRIYIYEEYHPYHLFYGGDIRISSNFGLNWTRIFYNNYTAPLTMNFSNDNFWLISYRNNGLYSSTDNGANWILIENGLHKYSSVNNIEYVSDTLLVSDEYHFIYYSTNEGKKWDSLEFSGTKKIRINSNNNIFIATQDKVYSLTFINDLPVYLPFQDSVSTIYDMFIDSAGYLYIGYDNGLLRSEYSTLTEIEKNNLFNKIDNYSLFQNYPNPFNPATIIEYQLPIESTLIIKLYDLLGREITTLVNEERKAGRYKIEFNTDNYKLSSGVYFVRMTAKNNTGIFSETKKMVLLK